jgi:hypothetical protein
MIYLIGEGYGKGRYWDDWIGCDGAKLSFEYE